MINLHEEYEVSMINCIIRGRHRNSKSVSCTQRSPNKISSGSHRIFQLKSMADIDVAAKHPSDRPVRRICMNEIFPLSEERKLPSFILNSHSLIAHQTPAVSKLRPQTSKWRVLLFSFLEKPDRLDRPNRASHQGWRNEWWPKKMKSQTLPIFCRKEA